jgi:hypothetical protein
VKHLSTTPSHDPPGQDGEAHKTTGRPPRLRPGRQSQPTWFPETPKKRRHARWCYCSRDRANGTNGESSESCGNPQDQLIGKGAKACFVRFFFFRKKSQWMEDGRRKKKGEELFMYNTPTKFKSREMVSHVIVVVARLFQSFSVLMWAEDDHAGDDRVWEMIAQGQRLYRRVRTGRRNIGT